MTSLEMQTNYQLMFLNNHVLMLRKRLETFDAEVQEALEPKLTEMENWVNENGLAFGEGNISSNDLSKSLDGIWSQLSDLSEEAQLLQNKQLNQEVTEDTAHSTSDYKQKLSEMKQDSDTDQEQECNYKL